METADLLRSRQMPPIVYRDLYFRLIICLIAAHVMIMHGEDFSTLEAFTKWSYYPTLAINYAIALAISWYVKAVTTKLDRHFDWNAGPLVRGILQFALGIVLGAVLSFFFVLLYFLAFGQDLMASTYPEYEFPLSVALIALLNCYYVLYYYRVRFLQFIREQGGSPIAWPSTFIVNTATSSIPVEVSDISYFFIQEGALFVRTSDMPSLNDAYPVAGTLKELEEILDPSMFFRINRQMLVSFRSVRSFAPGKGRTLELTLDPPLYNGKPQDMPEAYKRLCTVSEDRAQAFREWMER